MAKKSNTKKSTLKMTKWESAATHISGLSAMPLGAMFFFVPVGAVLGAVVGGIVASTAAVGVLSGLAIGAVGGLVTGGSVFSYGHIKARFAKKKYEARVIKIKAAQQAPTMSWHQKITAVFNNAKNNDVSQKVSVKKTAQPKSKTPQNKK